MIETCYMCESLAVSREHVPPKCVFPAQKDVGGLDYRKGLITVPSCDIHNSAKSKDDEYLMMILTSYFNNNQAAQDQINTKIKRAWTNNPKLALDIVRNLRAVKTQSGEQHSYEVDTLRFDQSLAWIANGLHFHQYGAKALPPYKVISYPLVQFDSEEAAKVNVGRAVILEAANEMFKHEPIHGDNPSIFWYQISPSVEARCVVRMCFFESFQVIAMSSTTLEA